ncbi:aldehyde dehydrogenase family 3 member B2-like isoform X2 [Delphinus delphis]|nr:aldehyde dehydrogenase family 3 member B2-like isoform X2 [Delphinus delphis]
MAAAAKHLTPVTLELGGKNPCYVDDNCDPQTVANRVAFFRYFNSGQTCVAPNYILCSPEMQARLLPALQSAITRFYGEDPQSSPDLGRIISEKNFQRLRGLLSCGHVAIGGQTDESDRYIAPTVLVGVQETEPVMREEIFGPILPIMNVRSLDEAIEFIRCREKPLALYAFSNSSQVGLDRGGNNRGAQKGETGHLPFPGPLVRVRAAGASSVAIIQATGQRLPAHRCLAETGSSVKKLATRGWPTVCPGRGSSRPDDETTAEWQLPQQVLLRRLLPPPRLPALPLGPGEAQGHPLLALFCLHTAAAQLGLGQPALPPSVSTLSISSAPSPRAPCPAVAQVLSGPPKAGVLSRNTKILLLGPCLNRPLAGQDLWDISPALFRAKVLSAAS